MDIGKKLKEKRLEENYTQKELAEILHVSRQTISSWEVGRTYPDLDVLIAISELYNTPLDDLLKEDSEMVKDITEKVKKSERRKVLNIVLGTVLTIILAVGLFSLWEDYQNNQVNEYGLKPNDIIESTWVLSYTPLDSNFQSILSFSKDSMVAFDTLEPELLKPYINRADLTGGIKKEEGKDRVSDINLDEGMTSILVSYENLKVEVVDEVYYITAQGYVEEFKRISETEIRSINGSEYRKIDSRSSHERLQSLAKHLVE